jgi:hypothetical protein
MNIIRQSFSVFAITVTAFTSFAQNSTNSPAKSSSAIIGTWQWIGYDQQAIPSQNFRRFYSNGTAAAWPTPEGVLIYHSTNKASRFDYHFDGAVLIDDAGGAGTNNPPNQVEIKGDEMVITGLGETNRYIMHRVVPDLEPGMFLPGDPNHRLPNL